MRTKVEALQHFFAAINRNDMQAISEDFAPDIMRVEPDSFPTAGTCRGIEEVREHLRAGRGSWAEGSCDPEGFFVEGDRAVVFLYAWVRLHGATDWTGGRFADGFVFREGKIIEYRSFAERADALAWPASTPRHRLSSTGCSYPLTLLRGPAPSAHAARPISSGGASLLSLPVPSKVRKRYSRCR